ncbi:LOW QUALITY PROTEIN: delta(14)-sterol reductase LBR [Xenentodon cancila]
MPPPRYQKGDMVMGRWPGSSLYYEVKVLGFDAKSRLYTVIYKDGTELELKEQDVMSATGFQTRSRSRSRSRSPGRRRSRSRSPARTTRYSSSHKAALIVECAPSSCRDTRQKDAFDVRLSPMRPEAYFEGDSEKNQGRYNLRSRKNDKDATSVDAMSQKPEVKRAEVLAASAATFSFPLHFGGKTGAYFWLLFLPAWVAFVLLHVHQEDPSLANFPPSLPPLEMFWDAQALGFVLLWILFQALLYILPFRQLSEGMPLHSGKRLKYRTNGVFAIAVSAVLIAAVVHQGVDLTYIYSHFLQLATASFLISVVLSIYLYVRSGYSDPEQLALGEHSGNVVYDFFKGRELNPHIKGFDLRFFCEMRPGLIGWCLINLAMALAEMKQQGLDMPSYSMILVNLFQLLYVVHRLWNEEAILTTMDLANGGFGFMLAFGNLVWVPFTYTLQSYYLVRHPISLNLPVFMAIILLKLIGFYIFWKSNSEKKAFRRNPSDPNLSYLKTLSTATGESLLVSGWWGVIRHPNYLGDLIMARWSLPCGFNHLLPWHYVIYFIIVLVHRDSHDTNACRRKYGSTWDEYCQIVRYRIIPCVY